MNKKVCVLGLGRIGLPMALVLQKEGYKITGVDLDPNVLDSIRLKKHSQEEPGILDLLNRFPFPILQKPVEAEIYLIAVPTPLLNEKRADLSSLHNAIDSLLPILKKGDLVIIESTCPIGTTKRLQKKLPGALLAYCPERVLPGNLLYELIHNDRIIGGVNPEATEIASSFYSTFVKGKLWETDASTAEAVKLAENAYRDVNIAYANELSMIADTHSLSSKEIIQLANHHPRVNILNPGPGVGGHCISVDPYFLMENASEDMSIIACARLVNEKKKHWVLEKIKKEIKNHQCKKIACLGLTYKPNVQDFRESPALFIMETLAKDYPVIPIDPFYEKSPKIEWGIDKADMIVALVAHDVFKDVPQSLLKGKTILDFAGVFD